MPSFVALTVGAPRGVKRGVRLGSWMRFAISGRGAAGPAGSMAMPQAGWSQAIAAVSSTCGRSAASSTIRAQPPMTDVVAASGGSPSGAGSVTPRAVTLATYVPGGERRLERAFG